MAVVKFPSKIKPESIDDIKNKMESGVYVELFIAAVRNDGSVAQIEIKQPWIDQIGSAV
jgi:hypothetical protein